MRRRSRAGGTPVKTRLCLHETAWWRTQSLSNASPQTKFPANREINRENRKIEPDDTTRPHHLMQHSWRFLAKFPMKTNRELFLQNRETMTE